MEERPLTGGNVTAGVVRVGGTVRRPRQESSPFVRRLLLELERVDFDGGPRHLGLDALGRDVLTFFPGQVEPRWRRFADEQVAAGADLLRRYHDATRLLDLRGDQEVVCHGDAGPHNCVFQDGLPVALLDFDLAAPGPATRDVAYAGWAWCLSSKLARGPVAEQARQLALFAAGYGLPDRAGLVDAVLERMEWSSGWWQARLEAGLPPSAERIAALIAWNRAEHAYVAAHRATFQHALDAEPDRG